MTDQATAVHSIDSIVDQLDSFRQRATYGAVASIVNRSPRNLMDKRSRGPRDSWVVSRQSGMPTGYEPEQLHPELTTREKVISTREELQSWLANPN